MLATRMGAVVGALFFAAASAAAQNPNNENDLVLHNGVDVVFLYSDPSVGFSAGTNPPDITNGDWYWKVWAKEALRSATTNPDPITGNPVFSLEMSGYEFYNYDTDWSDSSQTYDRIITPGKNSTVNPGNIEPDFGSLLGVQLLGATSTGFANPCTVNPALCAGGTGPGCPPAGFVNGYIVDAQIGTGADDGIIWPQGALPGLDWTIASFLPGGMPGITTGGGACGMGNYTIEDAHSTDEQQPDWLGTGYSAFGGFNVPGSGPTPEPVTDVGCDVAQFVEPIVQARVNPGSSGPEHGLATLHPSVSTGQARLGYTLFARQSVGDLAFVAGCVLPPFPPPGIPIFGANVMLNLTDPTVINTLRSGLIVLGDVDPDTSIAGPPVGEPFNDGVYQTPTPGGLLPFLIPPTAANLNFHIQGIALDLVTLTAIGSQLFIVQFEP